MYTPPMRRMTKPIAIAGCLCLLTVQFSGLHMHRDAEGYVGVPETAHTHRHGHDDYNDAIHFDAAHDDDADHRDESHDYEGVRDVSFFDLSLSPGKIPLAILAFALLFLALPHTRTLAGRNIVYPVLSGRHTRWRPPLRAPPHPATI